MIPSKAQQPRRAVKLTFGPLVYISFFFAVVSLIIAWLLRTQWPQYKDPWGYMLLAAWALIPPVKFLHEFAMEFPKGHDKPDQDVTRRMHLQDLSRNIWLAFVVVLSALMGIKWPFG